MANFSFDFSGDDFDERDNHAEDVIMAETAPSILALRPEKHRLEDLV
jgi:hypothetical protein